MTAREEILAAARHLTNLGNVPFSPSDLLEELRRRGTDYPGSTLRTHITSIMCIDAPRNHPAHYPDLKRVGRGRYRLAGAAPEAPDGPDAPVDNASESELGEAVARLAQFLGRGPLTSAISELEQALDGSQSEALLGLLDEADVDEGLFAASLVARAELGRINDLIHAAGIALALPHLLEPSETITNRPSLAAGNDPSRPYDLETDRRVAEFKFSVWTGRDAMRKRQTFKDFVYLAADESGRRRCLYVIGQRPLRFLRATQSPVAWGLDRHPAGQRLFEARFGALDQEIGAFVRQHGEVEIVDLSEAIPALFGGLER